MLELLDYLDSGNGYKVRLLLAHLQLPYRHREFDIVRGETRTAEFLAINPNGRIPVLRLDDGTYLSESDAILWYLAEGTPYLPAERLARARILQWMFFEQYSHEPFVATPRFIVRHLPTADPRRAELPQRLARGREALALMETHFRSHDYLVAERYTIADIALYAYTHVAEEGGHDLAPFPQLRAWLARVAAQPRHVGLFDRPEPV
jgi:glutathione S-transferase